MKQILIGLLLSSMITITAFADNLVEIRHKSLKDGNHSLVYWCLEKNQIPPEYTSNPAEFTIGGMAMSKEDSGVLIASYGDGSVFLTTEACLDETIAAYTAFGGTAADLTITRK